MTTEDYNKLLGKLENEDERRIVQTLLETAFPEMIDYFQAKVTELRAGILSESIADMNRLEIAITIWEKDKLGVLDDGLFTVKTREKESSDIIKQGQYIFFPVFIEADDREIQKSMGKTYVGKLSWKNQELEVAVGLKKNASYEEIVAQLKKSFLLAGYKWTPLNSAYLDKFYYFVAEIPEELKNESDTAGWSLRVEDFDLDVRERIVPVWNVEHITITASDFPVIQENKLLYRYSFVVDRDAEYIPDHQMELDGEFVRQSDSLHVLTKENELSKFVFWKVVANEWERIRTAWPVLSNGTKRLVIGKHSDCPIVHSAHELEKLICQLSVSEYYKYNGYKVRPNDYFDSFEAAYDVVKAKEDEDLIVRPAKRDYLELEFENKGIAGYLSRNLVQFVVDIVQREFNEYRVIAALN